jgi:uncharacterized protein
LISVSRILPHFYSTATRSRSLASLIAIIVALLCSVEARSAPPTAATATPPGLLWKVEGRDYKPSYLFGTIHIADPRVTELPPPVRTAFDTASHLILEVVPDVAGLGRLAQAMRFTDGRGLKQAVGTKMYADARAAFATRGMPLEGFDDYKPWAVTLILLLPDPRGGMPLDFALQVRAAEAGLTVEGLETMKEQIEVFDGLTLDDQRALLAVSLRHQAKLTEHLETLVQAYLARDLAKLQEIAEADELSNPALHAMVIRRLLTDRNRRMVARMQLALRRGNAFIAVGAAHLPGPLGIVKLLEREGYNVSAVY